MNLLKRLFGNKSNHIPAEEGYCPNCWGIQEYQNQIRESAVREKIDLNNIKSRKGWIQAYAAQNLTGLKMIKKGDKETCPSCYTKKLG